MEKAGMGVSSCKLADWLSCLLRLQRCSYVVHCGVSAVLIRVNGTTAGLWVCSCSIGIHCGHHDLTERMTAIACSECEWNMIRW